MAYENQSVAFHVVENNSVCFDAILAVNPAKTLQALSCRLREHSTGFLCVKKYFGNILQQENQIIESYVRPSR